MRSSYFLLATVDCESDIAKRVFILNIIKQVHYEKYG